VKLRTVAGVECVVLKKQTGASFAIPREWTDRGGGCPYSANGLIPPILSGPHLLLLAELIERIKGRQEGGLDK
jgi:hypothetical protein